jgi:iron(III) transport system ATP-binding protein
VLSVRAVRKTFPAAHAGEPPVVALDGVDLEVAEGRFATVLGPSGSGKTTLLRCIAGFEAPDGGVIALAGRELVSPTTPSVRPHGRGVGIVPQEGALFPHLTVAQNIGFGLVGRARAGRRARVASLLELVGMAGLGDRRPHQLSGGQQQRVALARALAPEPALLLLDEPFSALDAKLRVELREEVRTLLRGLGTTALLVTHDQAEAMALADHLVVMRSGRVVAAGEPRHVYDRPADIELGRFLGDAVVLPGRAAPDGTSVDCLLGRLPVASWHGEDGPCLVLIRPEDLALEPLGEGRPPGPGPSPASGVVTGATFLGPDAVVHVSLEPSQEAVTARVPGRQVHPVGERVGLRATRPVCTYPPVPCPGPGSDGTTPDGACP